MKAGIRTPNTAVMYSKRSSKIAYAVIRPFGWCWLPFSAYLTILSIVERGGGGGGASRLTLPRSGADIRMHDAR